MLYYLFSLLQDSDIPGVRLMDYLTFRSGVALLMALFIAMVFGRKIIDRLQRMQVGEIVRDLDLEGQMKKTGTPTMGGIIIIVATVLPCLLMGNLANVYMILMLVATVWLGALGFADDYLKMKRHNKDGMSGKFKIIGQVGLGLIVGLTMMCSPDIVMRQNHEVINHTSNMVEEVIYESEEIKATQTTLREGEQLRLCRPHRLDGRPRADRRLDSLHLRGDIHRHRHLQRRKPHRRP